MERSRRSFFKRLGFLFSAVTGGFLGRRESRAAAAGPSTPPDAGRTRRLQPASTVEDDEPPIRRTYDLVVVGGGIAGTSCAISAARHGVRVALVHNRSMLGGNSSSEVKLYPEDNSWHQPWIKEGGIHEEFHLEERVRNHRPYKERGR